MKHKELELELIQTHMARKPMLRVKVGARALRNQAGWAGGGSGGARAYVVASSRGNIPRCELMGLNVGDPFLSPAENLSRRRR